MTFADHLAHCQADTDRITDQIQALLADHTELREIVRVLSIRLHGLREAAECY